jgi:hypothetical protein
LGVFQKLALVTAIAFAVSGAAQAAVTIGAVEGGSAAERGGTFKLIAAPSAVGRDNQQAFDLFAFNERQGVTLLSSLTPSLGATIAAGTRVNSQAIVFDPPNNRSIQGWVQFSGRILGVFVQRDGLEATNLLLGAPGTTYNMHWHSGLEASDSAAIDPSNPYRLNVSLKGSSPGDLIRVVTAVPEVSTWMMLVAGFGVVGLSVRRRELGAVSN